MPLMHNNNKRGCRAIVRGILFYVCVSLLCMHVYSYVESDGVGSLCVSTLLTCSFSMAYMLQSL